MSYGTVPELFLRHPYIGSVSTITSAVAQMYLSGAAIRLESALSVRYGSIFPVSVNSAPIMKEMEITLSAYMMLKRFFTQEKENKSEWVESFLEEVDWMLKPLLTGSATLIPGLASPSAASDMPWSSTQGYVPTFDIGDPGEWAIDPQRELTIRRAKGYLP